MVVEYWFDWHKLNKLYLSVKLWFLQFTQVKKKKDTLPYYVGTMHWYWIMNHLMIYQHWADKDLLVEKPNRLCGGPDICDLWYYLYLTKPRLWMCCCFPTLNNWCIDLISVTKLRRQFISMRIVLKRNRAKSVFLISIYMFTGIWEIIQEMMFQWLVQMMDRAKHTISCH